MPLISPQQLGEFLSPQINALFNVTTPIVVDEFKKHETEISSFIQNPRINLLIISYDGALIFQSRFEGQKGPYLICQKIGDLDESYKTHIILMPFLSNTEFPFLQNFSNGFMIPFIQNSVQPQDPLSTELLKISLNFGNSLNKFQCKSNMPDPKFEIENDLFDINESSEISLSQQVEILNASDEWETKATAIYNVASNPPHFNYLSEEISFWTLLFDRMETLSATIDVLSNSYIPTFIEKYHKGFQTNFFNKMISEIPTLSESVSRFKNQLDTLPLSLFDDIKTIDNFIESSKTFYEQLLSIHQKASKAQFTTLYPLVVKFITSKFIDIISHLDLSNMNSEEFQFTLEKIQTLSSVLQNSRFEKESSYKIFERINEFSQFKEETMILLEGIMQINDVSLDKQKMSSQLQDSLDFIANSIPEENKLRWNNAILLFQSQLQKAETEIGQTLVQQFQLYNDPLTIRDLFIKYAKLCHRPIIQNATRHCRLALINMLHHQLEIIKSSRLVNVNRSELVSYMLIDGTVSRAATYLYLQLINSKIKKVEDILTSVIGENWKNSTDCKGISALIEDCKNIANSNFSIDAIINQSQHIEFENSFIFEIKNNSIICQYSLDVNNAIQIYESVYPYIPTQLKSNSTIKYYKQHHKYAIRISESVFQFIELMKQIDKSSEIKMITSNLIAQISKLFEEGWQMTWSNPQINSFSKEFNQTIVFFSRDVKEATKILHKIDNILKTIETSSSQSEKIKSLPEFITSIQMDIDQLYSNGQLSNNTLFVSTINQKIAAILGRKVDQYIIDFKDALAKNQPLSQDNSENAAPLLVKISFSDNSIKVNPPSESLHPIMNKILLQKIGPLLNVPQIALLNQGTPSYFKSIIKVPYSTLNDIYQMLFSLCSKVEEDINKWSVINDLFLSEPSSRDYGNNIPEWVNFSSSLNQRLENIQKFPLHKDYGVVQIDTSSIKQVASNRLDNWISYSSSKLSLCCNSLIKDMTSEVSKAQKVLAAKIPSKAKELPNFLTSFANVSSNQKGWCSQMEELNAASPYAELEGFKELGSQMKNFNQQFSKRKGEIDKNKAAFKSQVARETESFNSNILNLQHKWDASKPTDGETIPELALQSLSKFTEEFEKQTISFKDISSARESLELTTEENKNLLKMIDECKLMTEVWNSMISIWQKYHSLTQQSFGLFMPTEFKNQIMDIIDILNNMSPTYQEFNVWQFYQGKMKGMLKIYPTLEGLKSPAITPRHWSQIGQQFKTTIDPDSLNISTLLDFDLDLNSSFFSELIRNAQGEFSLYQYLESLNSTWSSMEFQFSLFKDKIQLIQGWDVIMQTIADHLNFLSTMQSSPFYPVFREQATNWENQLNQLQVLLDEWIDVQRRYVYLEGVFGSPDIRTILGKATANFKKCEKEFITLSKRAGQSRIVIKIASISNIQQTLQSLNDSLIALQKELSDYLEKQRAFFPRFFFIGDEDLLEIIGKSSDISDIQRHFGKMFEGLAGVQIEGENITGIRSGEGEIVSFKPEEKVSISSAVYQTLGNLENQMRDSLRSILSLAIQDFSNFWTKENMEFETLKAFIDKYPAQIALLCLFIQSTIEIEQSISQQSLEKATEKHVEFIQILSQLVFSDLTPISRHSVQQLITECVHQRNLTRELPRSLSSPNDFDWTRFLRFYSSVNTNDELVLNVKIGDASFTYGFEYLGLNPTLVRTPLTDRVYLTMAQALFAKMGGSPFGPAGTGKTETVKNMGHHLGRHVLVFNCDETFDFKAMGRIFVGLCHCGSWGCFDEFNRLDEQMLSAVSQQIQMIQAGLKSEQPYVTILGKRAPLNQNMGIFITMNPGYAGRVELPDNLKQLFRTIAMNRPDIELITEVLLFSQGFSCAEILAPKFVTLFSMAKESLSSQTHYDFGLRAMKAVLTNAGHLIRSKVNQDQLEAKQREELESRLLVSSIVNTLFPKLLANDLDKLRRIMNDVFPSVEPERINEEDLLGYLKEEAESEGFVQNEVWINKIVQLYYIQEICHGFMLVGPSATGKTSARTVLLRVLSKLDKMESESYIINPKSVTKDTLFGSLDPVTREWTDGVFTRILRTIVDNQRGEMQKRHWIIFDGDVDPEWVENLNSVLDDNKLLTLPNGERISLPSNVRIVFEVENLNFATPATVSRCGIVFFSHNTLQFNDILESHIYKLSHEAVITQNHLMFNEFIDVPVVDMVEMQKKFVETVKPTLKRVLKICSQFWSKLSTQSNELIMDVPPASCISTLFSLLSSAFVKCFRISNPDTLLVKATLFSIFWAFASPCSKAQQQNLDQLLRDNFQNISPPGSLLSFYISFEAEDWIGIESNSLETSVSLSRSSFGLLNSASSALLKEEKLKAHSFIPTPETEIARQLIQMSLIGGQSVILCGPNGIGKQSSLDYALSTFSDIQTVRLNLSNCSTVDFVLKTLEQYAIYQKSSTATRLKPKSSNTYLVFVCNQLNLPSLDKYGTQRVVEFLRQLLELNGFWHPYRREWIQLELIAFASVCVPPSFYGRVKLNPRFLRHTTVIDISHPSQKALESITSELLEDTSTDEAVQCIIQFYQLFRDHFRSSDKPHYIANLNDLLLWIESFKAAADFGEPTTLLLHEGLRVFSDRLSEPEEQKWVTKSLYDIILKHYGGIDTKQLDICLNNFNYTRLIDGQYNIFANSEIVPYLKQKLKLYNEEGAEGNLIFFDECIDTICRIERRLKQPQGHMYISGLSGTGKILIPTFVAFYSTPQMQTFRLRVYKGYNLNDFDADLRKVMKTCLDGPVVFVIKESDIMSTTFTERLNVLMAESQVPGLFTGDEYLSLLAQIKDTARADGQMIDTEENLFEFFIEKVKLHLHIVYITNSATTDVSKTDIMFPSLFTHSSILWIGTNGNWSSNSLTSFAKQILTDNELQTESDLLSAFIKIHESSCQVSQSLSISNFVSPRYFFDLVKEYCTIFKSKTENLQNEQKHLQTGLEKLESTQKEVAKMGEDLTKQKAILKEKEELANQKLEEIVKDRQATSGKKEEAEKFAKIIQEKRGTIDTEKQNAQKELDNIIPLIEEAKNSVSKIPKRALDEVRSMNSPAPAAKATLSAVLIMLGNPQSNWQGVRKVMAGESFIRSILTFNIETITPKIVKDITSLIKTEKLTQEKASNVSLPIGSLFKWVDANLHYMDIVDKTEPLREKIEKLEVEAKEAEVKHKELMKTVNAAEAKLKKLTDEYKELLNQCEQTRQTANTVQIKLDRAKHVIDSLASETSRWNDRRSHFQVETNNLRGNSILSASFIIYCGFLEQQKRIDSVKNWELILDEVSIPYKENYDFADFMVDPKELISWTEKQLPKDDLCIQNAVILNSIRSRMPFIIDPAGQAIAFIQNTYSNLIKTSFVDPKFPKHLESCIRFGSPLLIEDGEQFDPLVLPILSREFKRASGRTLLELKHNEIDVSPSFMMFIITRDTDYSPTPSISSMTTLINFSVTTLSLKAQCLTRLLTFKLPDIEKKRQELHQSLATMQVSLRNLEEKMLNVFSTVKGEILENDEVLHLLEQIKDDAKTTELKAQETRNTLQKITAVSEEYASVAQISTSFYFALREMGNVHFLYQFSLDFFWKVFDAVAASELTPQELIETFANSLFTEASYSLLNRHIVVLGFRFGQILSEYHQIFIPEALFDLALRGSTLGEEPPFMTYFEASGKDESISKWLEDPAPESHIEDVIRAKLGLNDSGPEFALKVLSVMRKVRPDRVIAASKVFIKEAFGRDIDDIPPLDILKLIKEESAAHPILLCAEAGQDVSERVEAIGKDQGIETVSLAIGSADSYSEIQKAVTESSKSKEAKWIIVKNIHLAPLWIRTFVKSLNSNEFRSNLNHDFRLILTSEINPKVGSNVFRSCHVIVFESATGIKANMRRINANIQTFSEFFNSGKAEISHNEENSQNVIKFMWLHSIIMERLRFIPLGWSKKYEYNDSDLRFATQVSFRWIKTAEQQKLPVPYQAIRFLLDSCIYGGRIDVPTDLRTLHAIAELIFSDNKDLPFEIPKITNAQEYQSWIESISTGDSPELFWLPKDTGKFLFIQQGAETLMNILMVSSGVETGMDSRFSKQSSFVKALLEQWSDKLSLADVAQTVKIAQNQSELALLCKAIQDELSYLDETRQRILSDIKGILGKIMEGNALTQKDRNIIEDLVKGSIPEEWNKHKYLCNDLPGWMRNLIERIDHLNSIAGDDDLGRYSINLGLFKSPESLLAAARQTAAHVNHWPVEKVQMKVQIAENTPKNDYDIVFVEDTSVGAVWKDNCLVSSEEVLNPLPPSRITWVMNEEVEGIIVPCFMTISKKRQVFECIVPVDKNRSSLWWTARSPAIILQENAL